MSSFTRVGEHSCLNGFKTVGQGIDYQELPEEEIWLIYTLKPSSAPFGTGQRFGVLKKSQCVCFSYCLEFSVQC